MPSAPPTEELLNLLAQAADEIASLDSPANAVCRRLRAMQRTLSPQSVSVAEIARRVDEPPRDVLDAAIAAGVRVFRHEGRQFRSPSYLKTYLSMQFAFDPVPELEFDLGGQEAERLAEELGVGVDELMTDGPALAETGPKPLRKFAPSEPTIPDRPASREQLG